MRHGKKKNEKYDDFFYDNLAFFYCCLTPSINSNKAKTLDTFTIVIAIHPLSPLSLSSIHHY